MTPIASDLAGHGKQLGQLLNDIAKENLSHAYLFVGAPHIGKFSTAKWFALQILADKLPPATKPIIREQMEKLIHQDFLVLDKLWIEEDFDDWKKIALFSNAPQQHRAKAPTAKTDTISIEDVRALHDRLMATGEGTHFCCLIRSAERMQAAAANAFLKLLEEPPPRVLFILTAESEQAVLPTVVSRTRVVRFSPLKPEEMRTLLKGRDDDDAAFALHVSQGAPGKLLRLLDDPEGLRRAKQFHTQARQFWQGSNLHTRLQWLMPLADDPQDLKDAILHLSLTLREYPEVEKRSAFVQALSTLLTGLQTNAHKGLLIERFSMAVST